MDQNAIISATLTELTKSFFSEMKKSSLDFLSKRYSYLFEDFSKYLQITYNRCNYVRTIINKDKSFDISEIYVPGSFTIEGNKYSDVHVMQEVRDSNPVVVLGFGGIGKTVFMKYLWLSIFKEPNGKIPIYIELRKFNNITDVSLLAYIRRTISPEKNGIDEGVFASFLESGRFVFIFDGFDEVSEAKKGVLSEEVVNLSYRYPANGYAISSRHDDRFSSWQRFKVFKACNFEKGQVLELVDKVPYEKDTKRKFVADILGKKYGQYETFLSTPLLTLMMLMTFSQFAEVPDRRHIFYRYAFMTLYSWHDSSKESFNREKQSGLVLDQFEQVFSTFCLISYLSGDVEFDEVSIKKYIGDVKKYVSFEFDVDIMLREITDTVNLLYRDGDKFLFTHRSFQEYFTAYAVVNYFQHKISDIIPRVYRGSDIVLGVMYEINRTVVDENFVIPEYDRLRDEIEGIISSQETSEISKILGFYYVGGFEPLPNSRQSLRIFGTEIQCKSWLFVRHLRSLFEFYPEIQELGRDTATTDIVNELNAIAKKLAVPEDQAGLTLVYDPSTSIVRYVCGHDNDIASFSEAIEKAITAGEQKTVRRKALSELSVRDISSIKANYVAIEKLVRHTKKLQKTKDKSIEELLM